ncbi:MAG: hypothetical protein AAF958_06830 [Planctomycetota bacterium]
MPKLSRRVFHGRLLAGGSLAGGVLAGGLLGTAGCVPSPDLAQAEWIWGSYGFSDGRFIKPRAITIDSEDRLYIVDTTGRIQVFDTDGNFLRKWKTPATENGRPTGLAFESATANRSGQPRILVADTHYYRVLAYSLAGDLIDAETIGGVSGSRDGEFAFVTDVTVDAQGNRYVGEYNASDRIQKFDRDGRFVCGWGGTGSEPGQFLRPQSLMVWDDVLYVADASNHRLQRFDLREERPRLIDIWSGPGKSPGQLLYPYGIDRTPGGLVVVIEYQNGRVQAFDRDGNSRGTWGAPGLESGQFNNPWGLVVDSRGRVHVLDSNNHRIQRIPPVFA